MVLGCTHYPLIVDELKGILPEVKNWVDSGAAIASRLYELSKDEKLSCENKTLYLSSASDLRLGNLSFDSILI